MPILANARHERFAQALASGKTADEAYKVAGYKPSRAHASRLAAKGNTKARIAELLAIAAEANAVTAQSLTRMLNEDRDGARGVKQFSAAITAVEKIGKLHGFFKDQHEVAGTFVLHMDKVDAEA